MQDLLTPQNCALVLLDQQAGLQFGVQSMERQTLLNNSVALLETALAFALPMVISTSASKVYSGPLLPDLHALAPAHPVLERRNMNAWEDDAVRAAIEATGRKKLIFAGISLEVCAAFPAMTAVARGLDAYVAVDASGTFSQSKREAGLLRMQQHGVILSDYATLMVEILKDNGRKEAGPVYAALDMPWATLVGQIAAAYGK